MPDNDKPLNLLPRPAVTLIYAVGLLFLAYCIYGAAGGALKIPAKGGPLLFDPAIMLAAPKRRLLAVACGAVGVAALLVAALNSPRP